MRISRKQFLYILLYEAMIISLIVLIAFCINSVKKEYLLFNDIQEQNQKIKLIIDVMHKYKIKNENDDLLSNEVEILNKYIVSYREEYNGMKYYLSYCKRCHEFIRVNKQTYEEHDKDYNTFICDPCKKKKNND